MTSIRRFRNPFLPIHPLSPTERLLVTIESLVKGIIFNCSMCGNCILQETAYICPMQCPKGLRNGPCGSGSSETCCVEPQRPCVWHHIYERAEALGKLDRLLEVQAPLDWNRVGRETWGQVLSELWKRGLISPKAVFQQETWKGEVSKMFQSIRQPEWWQGDYEYHGPEITDPVSKLHAALERGDFVITAELSPPLGSEVSGLLDKAAGLQNFVHAVNVTQNPMASTRMSSLATSAIISNLGMEAVMQITARDFNRLTLQSTGIGASALGIHNILCLTGDPPTDTSGPISGLPFDLDATQMLWILRRLRDKAILLNGRTISSPPRYFLGAAGSPNNPNLRHEALRLEKKINAGAQFIQTQLVFDIGNLERWLSALDAQNLLEKVHVLVGIGPLRSVKIARYLQENIPDIGIPDDLIERLASSDNQEATGMTLAIEILEKVKNLSGVAGVHLMGVGWEECIPKILAEAGLTR